VKKRVGLLIAITVTVWAVTAYPAQLHWGEAALVHSAAAAGLCLVPTALTMLWTGWASRQSPEQQLVTVLGGTGVRMGVVLGAGLALYSWVPSFGQQSFWVWVLLFYLLTLALEMVLVVKGQPSANGQPGPASARSAP
jgi:hypothetical protein